MTELSLDRVGGALLSAFRIVVGFLFLCHGLATVFGLLAGPNIRPGVSVAAPIGQWPSWWAGLIQLVGGGLVLIGLFTRPAALISSGAMAFAYFSVHQPKGILPIQNFGELAAMYSWIFLLIAVLGPGTYALDTLLRQATQRPSVAGVPPQRRRTAVLRRRGGVAQR